MKQKRVKRATKKTAKKKRSGPPLNIAIDVGPNATLDEVEDKIEKALAERRTELFRHSDKVVIKIKEEGW